MTREIYIPIRVDVTSNDELRIVDTLLLDRNVLPVPLDADRLEDSLAENALYLAKSILADAEVIGMGRTVRHFTGRMDLWSWEMVEKIQKCIFDQLYAAFAESEPPRKEVKTSNIITEDKKEEGKLNLIPIRIRMELNGYRIHDDLDWDPSLDMDPLTLAKSIAHDLNVPSEAITELAAHIAEQMLGLRKSPEDVGPTAAWTLEPRVHQSNIAHLAVVNATKN